MAISSHPFYIASENLVDHIINDVDMKLSSLLNTYIPSNNDNQLFIEYGNNYLLLNTWKYFHPQFFFEIGLEIIEKTKEHEVRIGKEICKESVYAIMAICAVFKNDILNNRIYLEKMLVQRKLYNSTPQILIDLINNEPVFGFIKRETNRVFNDNSFIQKLQGSFFSGLDFTMLTSNLSIFHQKQFLTYILNYRLLHYSLDKPTCPDIIFEHCYTLIQNLCVLIESDLKEKKSSRHLLGKLITLDINEPYKSKISILNLIGRFSTNSISTFNTNLPQVITELDTCTNLEEMICYCLYISYMCRNQVLHNINPNLIFHKDGILTEKIIGILLSTIHFNSKV
jgi:hypothetical protein